MSCLACDVNEGRFDAPGGVIADRDGWIVDHCIGPLGIGTLIVKPRRHVVAIADLTDDEARAVGPLLRDAARVVRELTQPEQVYICLWSHAIRSHATFISWFNQWCKHSFASSERLGRRCKWRCSSEGTLQT